MTSPLRSPPEEPLRTRRWRVLRFTIVIALSALLLGWIFSPVRGVIITAILLGLDRLLLVMEAKRWINYRRVGWSRGAAAYHTFELSSVYEPGFQEINEVKYVQKKDEDDAGGPPAPE